MNLAKDIQKIMFYLFIAVGIIVLATSLYNSVNTSSQAQEQIIPEQGQETIQEQMPSEEDVRSVRVNGDLISAEDIISRQALFSALQAQVPIDVLTEEMIREKLLLEQAQSQDIQVSEQEAITELEMSLSMSGVTVEELSADLEAVGTSYQQFLDYYKNSLLIVEYLENQLESVQIEDSEVQAYAQSQGVDEEQARLTLTQEKQDEYVQNLIEDLEEQATIEYE